MLLDDAASAEPELEQKKTRKRKRYKSIAIIISLLLILIAVVGLTHKGAGQESSEVLSFDEMESTPIDIPEDTINVPMVGFDLGGR